MICPAVLDPFQGTNYRLNACFHQALLCPLLCKFFCYIFTPASVNKSTEFEYISNYQQSVCNPNNKRLNSEYNNVNTQINNTKIETIWDDDKKITNGISGCDVKSILKTDNINNFPNFCKKVK